MSNLLVLRQTTCIATILPFFFANFDEKMRQSAAQGDFTARLGAT
jgi:hypothetical protein